MFLAEQYKPDNIKNNYIHYWVEFIKVMLAGLHGGGGGTYYGQIDYWPGGQISKEQLEELMN